MPRLNDDHYEQIIFDYLSGMNQKDVADKNGIGRDAVHNILVTRGITPRPYTGERISNKKWEWNHNFFNEQTPITAYWAGFLMADGCLQTHGGHSTLIIVLHGKDKEHVGMFCDAVGISRDVMYKRKDKFHFGVHLNYYGLTEQLKSWGIVPRKTYEYIEPQVDDELLSHYLRGWCDGDGCVYSYGRAARFTICGNKFAIQWYADKLRELGFSGHINIHPHHGSSDLFSDIYIGGQNQVNKIRELLLVDSSFKLERRWKVHYQEKRKTFTHACLNCGNSFEVDGFRHNGEPKFGKFCSSTCWGKFRHKEFLARKVESVGVVQ